MKRPPSALLLRLYPAAYRRDFEDEMLDVLCAASREAQPGGVWLNTMVTLRESRGLIAGALREHARQRFGEYPWFKVATRRFKMRSEFRYPRAAVPMMCLIFAGIMLAIYKARAIALSTGLVNVEPAHHMLPLTFGLALLVAALAGTLGWFLLHSMHRSGVHRLSNAETWPAAK